MDPNSPTLWSPKALAPSLRLKSLILENSLKIWDLKILKIKIEDVWIIKQHIKFILAKDSLLQRSHGLLKSDCSWTKVVLASMNV